MDPIIDYRSGTTTEVLISRYMSRVYGWMTFGLLITAIVSYVVATSPEVAQALLGGPQRIFFGFLLPIGVFLVLNFGINKLSVGAATFCFLLYSFTNGIMLSTIFMMYSTGTVADAFFVTSGAFAALAAYGSITHRDLRPLGTFMSFAVIGLLISLVINVFVHSSAVDFGLSVVGVVIFAGLTAYQSQAIRRFARMGDTESDGAHKMAIMGALSLYLSFINMFLFILQLMGGGRRRN